MTYCRRSLRDRNAQIHLELIDLEEIRYLLRDVGGFSHSDTAIKAPRAVGGKVTLVRGYPLKGIASTRSEVTLSSYPSPVRLEAQDAALSRR